MKQWHYVLVAVATVAAIIPAFAPSLLPIALIGTLLGVAAVFPCGTPIQGTGGGYRQSCKTDASRPAALRRRQPDNTSDGACVSG